MFQVIPEEDPLINGIIYIISQERVPGQYAPNIFSKRQYKAPMDNLPLYVKEMNCVLFITESERIEAINTYGTGEKLVLAYAANLSPLINASYSAITSISNKTFYQVSDGTIEEIPKESGTYVDKLMIQYDIPREKLETHYVFVINTVIRKGNTKNTKDVNNKTKIQYIEKSTIRPGEPIIFSYNGLVIFNEYKDAELFLRKYGSIESYMINLGLAVTYYRQEKQIEELNKRVSADKKSMVQVFSLMGGTSVLSILTKTLLQCVEDGESGNETFKKLFKILGIGIIGIGGVLGAYLLYKKCIQYKENKGKDIKRAA
jgi:hypothetical protein